LYEDSVQIEVTDLNTCLQYLESLHSLSVDSYPSNEAMMLLNYEHIFIIPFQEGNGLDLDGIQSDLNELSLSIKLNAKLKKRIFELGQHYLETGNTLIHGDFYFGSLLKTAKGLKVIDSEFSFLGFAEFDWAVLIAHLHMAEQNESAFKIIHQKIKENDLLDKNKIYAFAGVEVLRRLFGVAQLPLNLDIRKKEALSDLAVSWILA